MMEPTEWQVLESPKVIEDKWLTLHADPSQLPNGRIIEPYYVVEYQAWVTVWALTKNQGVVLVREFRPAL